MGRKALSRLPVRDMAISSVKMKPPSKKHESTRPEELQTAAPVPPRAKKRYVSPQVVRWGSLLELTGAVGDKGGPDGGRRPYRRTR
jgi:hypothetical protein